MESADGTEAKRHNRIGIKDGTGNNLARKKIRLDCVTRGTSRKGATELAVHHQKALELPLDMHE
jgi:hypothetical protein